MANHPPTWDQRPDYIAACDQTIRPGGPITYLVPRRGTASDVTDFHPGQWDWSLENLPEVIYQLYKDNTWDAFRLSGKPAQKVDANGAPMFERWPKPGVQRRQLLNFPILPDQIGTEEEAWCFEAWRRLDPRIEYEDIYMRMANVGTKAANSEKAFKNKYMNNAMGRQFRPKYQLASWHSHKRLPKQEVKWRAELDQSYINSNSTRGLTPGLINPALGDIPGNRKVLGKVSNSSGTRFIRGPKGGSKSCRSSSTASPSATLATETQNLTSSNTTLSGSSATDKAPRKKRKRPKLSDAQSGTGPDCVSNPHLDVGVQEEPIFESMPLSADFNHTGINHEHEWDLWQSFGAQETPTIPETNAQWPDQPIGDDLIFCQPFNGQFTDDNFELPNTAIASDNIFDDAAVEYWLSNNLDWDIQAAFFEEAQANKGEPVTPQSPLKRQRGASSGGNSPAPLYKKPRLEGACEQSDQEPSSYNEYGLQPSTYDGDVALATPEYVHQHQQDEVVENESGSAHGVQDPECAEEELFPISTDDFDAAYGYLSDIPGMWGNTVFDPAEDEPVPDFEEPG